jgi:hypothetical protein
LEEEELEDEGVGAGGCVEDGVSGGKRIGGKIGV